MSIPKLVCGKCESDNLVPWDPDVTKCMDCGAELEKLSDYKRIFKGENGE